MSPGKAEDIKDAVWLLYRNEGLRNDISNAAKETVKMKYNINDWIKQIEAEYMRTVYGLPETV